MPATPGGHEPPRSEEPKLAELAWAKTRFPELATFVPAAREDELIAELLGWVPAGETGTVFDRSCRSAKVVRRKEDLYGMLPRSFTRYGTLLIESFDEIRIGSRIDLFWGNGDQYEKNAKGTWELTASGGVGGWGSVGHLLSAIQNDAAFYDGALIRLTIACAGRVEEESACADGPRVCARCTSWDVFRHSVTSDYGIQRFMSRRRVLLATTEGCGTPCPPDAPPPDVTRTNAALEGQRFLHFMENEEHPFVFKTHAACRAYRRQHWIDANELDAWRAGEPRPGYLPPPPLPTDDDES